MTATPPAEPDVLPDEEEPVEKSRHFLTNWKLYASIAALFFTASIFLALVIAREGTQSERDRGDVVTGQLDDANDRLDDASQRIDSLESQIAKGDAAAACRSAAATDVNEAQAAAVLSIGDLAYAGLYSNDEAAVARAAADYERYREDYNKALEERRKANETCDGG